MAISSKYISFTDPDNIILVTREKNWTDIKVYANGKLQYKAENGKELRRGKIIEIEDYGTMSLQLKDSLEISLDGTYFEPSEQEVNDKVANVSVIFWVLTGFSLAGLLFMLLALNQPLINRDALLFIIFLQGIAITTYGITAVLLKRGIYWFYFVGAGMYTVFTALTIVDIELQLSTFFGIVAFIIRIVLLALVLRIIPIILKLMRNAKPDNDTLILDQ